MYIHMYVCNDNIQVQVYFISYSFLNWSTFDFIYIVAKDNMLKKVTQNN
jgi:hypothetical protein